MTLRTAANAYENAVQIGMLSDDPTDPCFTGYYKFEYSAQRLDSFSHIYTGHIIDVTINEGLNQ